MINCRRFCFIGQRLCFLGFLHFLLALGLIALHQLLLLFSQLSLLAFEFFHTLVSCPRSLEFSAGSISKFLPFHFELTPLRLAGQFRPLLLGTVTDKGRGRYAGAIGGIQGNAFVFKAVKLLVELCRVKLGLLKKPSQMVLLRLDFSLSCKPGHLLLLLCNLQILNVHLWRKGPDRHCLHRRLLLFGFVV